MNKHTLRHCEHVRLPGNIMHYFPKFELLEQHKEILIVYEINFCLMNRVVKDYLSHESQDSNIRSI